jgi:hypothetical protein
MEDRELLAAIGRVVVDAAVLESFVAVLVAVIDGHRDQDCEDHAVATVKMTGKAMSGLRMRACAQLRGQGLSLSQIARMLPMAERVRMARARMDVINKRLPPGVEAL